MEELTYQEALDKCQAKRMSIINSRESLPKKIMDLDKAFDEYCKDIRQIRKNAEAEKKKQKEEAEKKRKEEEYEKNGVPKRFH